MVIADSTFVKSGRANGLNTANAAVFNQKTEGVVDGLTRDGPDFVTGGVVDDIGGAVRVGIDGLHDGDALRSDVDPEMAKGRRKVGTHGLNSSTEFILSPNFVWKEDTADTARQCQNRKVPASNEFLLVVGV